MTEESFMAAGLDAARRGFGQTSPNPAVGAVLVRDGLVLATGFHRRAGGPHAEIEALRALPDPALARGATLFVTLEPCSTHGRTPPCVEAIIAAGIERVVIGAIDPNPAHAGRGIEILERAGIEVRSGVLGAECADLNRAFNKWIVQKLPWVIAKVGMSLDGRLTRPPGEGQWLTSAESRADAMQLRAQVDAILVGANTLRTDNPKLTVRWFSQSGGEAEGESGSSRQPWRIVVARQGLLPEQAHVFTDEYRDRTVVFRNLPLRRVLEELGRRQMTSVLIEGGMRVLGDALDQHLIDEVRIYLAPILCGGPVVAFGGRGVGASVEGAQILDPVYRRIGNDVCCSGRVSYPT